MIFNFAFAPLPCPYLAILAASRSLLDFGRGGSSRASSFDALLSPGNMNLSCTSTLRSPYDFGRRGTSAIGGPVGVFFCCTSVVFLRRFEDVLSYRMYQSASSILTQPSID